MARYESLSSCKELALVYHGLHQIHLVEDPGEDGHMRGLILALNAVNFAEASAHTITSDHLTDIYMATVLRIKASCFQFMQGIQR